MKLILLGPPGAGKGSQATVICEKYGIPQISTGDMLRQAASNNTPTGLEIKNIMETGAFVSDQLILRLVSDRVSQEDCVPGYLLDGFPRTISQAEGMKQLGISVDFVVELQVDDEIIIERISGRRIHPASGRTYHIKFDPPKNEGVDDETGEPLVHREDDLEHIVRKRLVIYHQKTAPLIDYYITEGKNSGGAPVYIKVDGAGDLKSVSAAILEKLSDAK